MASSFSPAASTPSTPKNRAARRVAEAWDAYRDSQPEDWEMLNQEVGDAYLRRRKI